MDVKQAIETRRAYRSLEPVEITEELTEKQAESEKKRPERLPLGEFAYMNRFTPRE